MAERDADSTDSSNSAPAAMDQFTAHIDRGWDLVHRGDLPGAQLSAEQSLQLDGQSPEAHNLLGYVKAAQGHADDAIELYRQAIALDDTFVEAMLNAAEVLIHPLHDFEAAISMVEEALDFAENDDERADALLLKYDAHMHQGDKDGAARVLAGFPDGPFDSPRLDFLVGRAHFETGNPEIALRLLQHAVEREPSYGDAHYTLGLLHEVLGDAHATVNAFLRTREADLALPTVSWAPTRLAFEQQVRAAIARLPAPMQESVADAELIVAELPGAEVVADGVDPRACLLLDTAERSAHKPGRGKVSRLFFYQRNTERAAEDFGELDDEIYLALEEELCATFPQLARYATQVAGDDSDGGH
jgi:tetratricopeptide (TPR) repeat protein